MCKERKYCIYLLLFFFLFLAGCAEARKYVSVNRGFVNLRLKKNFGQGKTLKTYYVTEQGDILNIGDSEDEVLTLLGQPSSEEMTISGYTIWVYKERNLKIYFVDKKIKCFQDIK